MRVTMATSPCHHPSIHLSVCLFIHHSFVRPFRHPIIGSFIRPCIPPFVHPFILFLSFIHPCIQQASCVHVFICPAIPHLFNHPIIFSGIRSSIPVTSSFIHPSMHPVISSSPSFITWRKSRRVWGRSDKMAQTCEVKAD